MKKRGTHYIQIQEDTETKLRQVLTLRGISEGLKIHNRNEYIFNTNLIPRQCCCMYTKFNTRFSYKAQKGVVTEEQRFFYTNQGSLNSTKTCMTFHNYFAMTCLAHKV